MKFGAVVDIEALACLHVEAGAHARIEEAPVVTFPKSMIRQRGRAISRDSTEVFVAFHSCNSV